MHAADDTAPASAARPPRWLFIPPILVGLLVLIVSATLSGGADRLEEQERSVPVRVLTVAPSRLVPTLHGHGEVRPDATWQGIVQVAGRIALRSPELRDGALVRAGTLLVAIDPLDYQLALRRAQAQQSAAAAALDELAVRADNLRASVTIESRGLELAEAELERRRLLGSQGHLSRLEVDAEEQRMLRQQQNLQSMASQLALIPAQREALRAQQAEAAAAVAKTAEDLERTRIHAPFDGRVREVRVEESQFAGAGQVMFTLEATSAVEIVVRVPLEQLANRFPALLRDGAGVLDALVATVRYRDQTLALAWPARVVRVDPSVDPRTRAAQLFLRVDNAAAPVPLGGHLYVEVEVSGPPLDDRIVIPRLALHDGAVFLVDDDQRLRRRPVTVEFRQDEVVVVRDGLAAGDRVILTDIPYPADGLLVQVEDLPDTGPATP
jgi:membrane fusion protein, multidrug efflux system